MFYRKDVLVLFCCLTLLFCDDKILKETLKVTLFYSSLCPFSREFIINELYPGYIQLKDSLILELIPYGNTISIKRNDTWAFHCQNGPEECFGNKIQACIVKNETFTQDEKIFLAACITASSDPSAIGNVKKCLSKIEIAWDAVSDCIETIKGNNMLANFAETTNSLNPPLEYIPYILFNGVFNKTIENHARKDFKSTVCALVHIKPDNCLK